ncbi:MAG TPA: hypothetical protein VJV04_11890 [Nitrospiraceae bacterium]|nr:hypothetical protein [Nitrospiraceae bacterium]
MSSAWLRGFITCFMLEAAFFVNGCSSLRPAPVIVHEGAYDVVVLEPLSREPPAGHPAFLEQEVMETILHGISTQDDERLLQRLLSGRMPPAAVFSDEQSVTLSRFLVAALAQASPQQQVRFRLSFPQSQGEETTQGTLYCAEPFLYFTLQQFPRAQPQTPHEKPGRQLPDQTTLGSRRLIFHLPASTGEMAENTSANSLVINYVHVRQWLASRSRGDPASAGRVSPLPSTADRETSRLEGKDQVPALGRTPSLNELIVRKDLEIESLKEEIRSLQQQLETQQRAVNRLKRLLDNAQRR